MSDGNWMMSNENWSDKKNEPNSPKFLYLEKDTTIKSIIKGS